ncbi:MAG: hypothetical protein GY782_11840 [Gammaproteobacteria bacterium]|nr:hypothetical protein [Gammaproteobacteria bacterium]
MPKMRAYTPASAISPAIKKAAKRIYDRNPDVKMTQAIQMAQAASKKKKK